MNSAKSGRAFLAFVIVDILFVTAIYAMVLSGRTVPDLDFAQNILLSESIVLVPILFMALIQKEKGTKINDFLGFHKIRFTTILLVILYTFLCIPLANFMNAVSMLFVDNVVGQVAGEVADMPFWLMFLTMAMFGPMCEELAFRGVIYHGYRRSRNLVGAVIISALSFGIMHMNFNQLGYAFALGVMMALLMEATGSVWATFIMHMVFNGQSVVTLFIEKMMYGSEIFDQADSFGANDLLVAIGIYAVIATVCTTLAVYLLNAIAEREGRHRFLQVVWNTRHNKAERLVTPAFITAAVLAVIFMITEMLLPYILYVFS